MISFQNTLRQKIALLLIAAVLSIPAFSQPSHVITDPEKKFKDAKELFVKEQYALAYPLLAELKTQYPENTTSEHTYLNDDVNYYYTVCQLQLQQPSAEQEAKHYIDVVNNEPRKELMSYYLAKFYFVKEDFNNALQYYEKAGLANLDNAAIADAKFEKAYSYFNLKLFPEAKPLFDEIRQIPNNKYYIPANYYFGYISFNDHEYEKALGAFKLVETQETYKDVVPYYIAEILYFRKKYDEALKYGQGVLDRGGKLYYQDEMKLLIGQLYFEKKDYTKALPLLEAYVSNNEKVTREVLYELSYCYYEAKNLVKAIDGFKQLSGEKDSMGQNSMYLLGDCYLRTGQKENARNAFQYCAYNSSNKKQQQVSRFAYAKLSYELGFQDIALKEIKSYLADYPGSDEEAEAKELLVGLMANTSNFSDALQLYRSFDKPTPSMQKAYPRILYGRAVEMINDQQEGEADSLLTNLIALPESAVTPYANFWKGELAYRNKDYDMAIRYLSFYLQSTNRKGLGEANDSTAKYDLGYSWLQKEQYRKALDYFQQLSNSPVVTSSFLEQDAYLRSADCYFMLKDFVKAGSMYDHVISISLQQSDYALFQKGMIAGIKSADEKIKVLNSVTRLYPQSTLGPAVNMEIANTYMADEKFRDAIPYLQLVLSAADAGGLKPKAYMNSGLSYYNINNNQLALENYLKLIDQYPESSEASEAMGNIKNIYIEEGRPNDYVDLMKKAGKSISTIEADSLTYNAAEMKYNAGNLKAAIDGFTNYIDQFPNGAFLLEAYYLRSDSYDKNKDWEHALPGYEYVNNKGQNKYFEKAGFEAARINYFELKDYAGAKKYFESIAKNSSNEASQLEALRGLIRCYYQLKDYAQANEAANSLLAKKGISTEDRSIALLVLGKSQQANNNCNAAINSFKSLAMINKAAWGAEARYEIAHCQFMSENFAAAEKSALAVIKETGSYDFWVEKAYILLGDNFMQQKDYFNAKATYESVARNSVHPELKNEAQEKLRNATVEEKNNSKVN